MGLEARVLCARARTRTSGSAHSRRRQPSTTDSTTAKQHSNNKKQRTDRGKGGGRRDDDLERAEPERQRVHVKLEQQAALARERDARAVRQRDALQLLWLVGFWCVEGAISGGGAAAAAATGRRRQKNGVTALQTRCER